MEGLAMQFWKTWRAKEQISPFQRILHLNDIEFEQELDERMYGDTDMLQLLKYLCQNKNDCLSFELKIIIIINRLIKIYLLKEKILA